MKKRTVVEFPASPDLWNIVGNWAKETGFNVREQEEFRMLYQKGDGFWVAPQKLDIRVRDNTVIMEVWVAPTPLARLQTLFLMPAEMHVDSGGFVAVLPRNIARKEVNKLLERLQAPLIE